MKLVIASGNKGKIREFSAVFDKLGYECLSIKDICQAPEPDETGTTFKENARQKALYYMEACGLPCLADDSGLVVDALGGAPGVYSARYAGHHGDDAANNAKLIQELKKSGSADWSGHYVAALCLAFPDGRLYEVEGTCSGRVLEEARGDGGFGYDPYFLVPQYDKTMAEMSLDQKEAVSHRGAAIRKLVALLEAQ